MRFPLRCQAPKACVSSGCDRDCSARRAVATPPGQRGGGKGCRVWSFLVVAKPWQTHAIREGAVDEASRA